MYAFTPDGTIIEINSIKSEETDAYFTIKCKHCMKAYQFPTGYHLNNFIILFRVWQKNGGDLKKIFPLMDNDAREGLKKNLCFGCQEVLRDCQIDAMKEKKNES